MEGGTALVQAPTVGHKGTGVGNPDLSKSSHCPDEKAREPKDRAGGGHAAGGMQSWAQKVGLLSQGAHISPSRFPGQLRQDYQASPGAVTAGKLSLCGWWQASECGSTS